jgi:hypothetical protein
MSRFVIQVSEKKRNRNLILGCLSIAFSLCVLAILISSLFSEVEVEGIRKIFYLVFVIQGAWSGFEYLQKRKRKEFYLEIDAYYLKWIMHETGNPVITNWDDVRWIKKEKNTEILIFRASSFSVGFSLKDFTESEQEQIVALLTQYATQKQIHLVNFSEPSLAIA